MINSFFDKDTNLKLLEITATTLLGIAAVVNGYLANKFNKKSKDSEARKDVSRFENDLVRLICIERTNRTIYKDIENNLHIFGKRMENLLIIDSDKIGPELDSFFEDFIETKYRHLRKIEFISRETLKIIESMSENLTVRLDADIFLLLNLRWHNIEFACQNTSDLINKLKKDSDYRVKIIGPNDKVRYTIKFEKLFENTI